MRHCAIGLGLIVLLTLIACEREGPPKPVGSATNKHVEQTPAMNRKSAADPITSAVKTPLDKAHAAEDTVQKAEELTRKQADQISP